VSGCPPAVWSYSMDGSLVNVPGDLFGVPHMKAAYSGKLDKQNWGLVRCPKGTAQKSPCRLSNRTPTQGRRAIILQRPDRGPVRR